MENYKMRVLEVCDKCGGVRDVTPDGLLYNATTEEMERHYKNMQQPKFCHHFWVVVHSEVVEGADA